MINRLGRPQVTLPRVPYLRAVQTNFGGRSRLRRIRPGTIQPYVNPFLNSNVPSTSPLDPLFVDKALPRR